VTVDKVIAEIVRLTFLAHPVGVLSKTHVINSRYKPCSSRSSPLPPQTPRSRPLRRLDRHVLGAQRGRAIEAKRHIRPYLFVSLQPTLSGATTAFVPPDMLRSRPMSSVCVSVVSRPSVCPSISGRGAEVQVCFFTQVGIFRK